MPSVSKKQHNLMEAVAHNPGFAKKVGISQKVGKHFHEADKKLKKGGNVKHANELEGKAKETKSIAKEEMKALKRGHAPKDILEHEKAEHKAMGYKHGGKIETPKKGFAMAESKGGRKPPHGKHTSEGDTKLKGFGMGKGLGHGRTVTKAKTPKDEMPRKGFAMKKGGHVKHHGHVQHMKKGRRVKAPRMAQMTPDADMPGLPAGLSGALGSMGGGPGGPPGGAPMPTMAAKKGGHISHHHHHHYAKGGHIKAGHKHEDGIAQKGHTRAKHVKMASGGHVGSHPSRRGDGIAHKGHTSCKMV
jgi:hypothetical protein